MSLRRSTRRIPRRENKHAFPVYAVPNDVYRVLKEKFDTTLSQIEGKNSDHEKLMMGYIIVADYFREHQPKMIVNEVEEVAAWVLARWFLEGSYAKQDAYFNKRSG